ncbi:hypothetical protein [Roseateles sp.]|uniref:hypothetical protein n=1 Tax=Roseateles sp. TaxID=1971397 RepID=UPI0039EB2D02
MKGLSLFRLGLRAKPATAVGPMEGPSGSEAEAITPASAADAAAGERRAAPRRDVPLGPTFRAEFTLLAKPRSFNVDDLSLGGLGLRGAVDQGQGIFVGQKLAQVRLVLAGHAALVADLEVRSYRFHRSFLIGEQLHVGCRFVNLGLQGELELRDLLAKLAELRGEFGGATADR